MGTRSNEFDAVFERCLLALRLKYPHVSVNLVERMFEAEIRLIRKLGFEDSLAQIVEVGDQGHG